VCWSVTSAFIGYKMSALIPRCPRFRAQTEWSMAGIKNASDFPDPVPVVTSVGFGSWPRPERRCQAASWWA